MYLCKVCKTILRDDACPICENLDAVDDIDAIDDVDVGLKIENADFEFNCISCNTDD